MLLGKLALQFFDKERNLQLHMTILQISQIQIWQNIILLGDNYSDDGFIYYNIKVSKPDCPGEPGNP